MVFKTIAAIRGQVPYFYYTTFELKYAIRTI